MEQGVAGRGQFRAMGQRRGMRILLLAMLLPLAACQQSVVVRPAALDEPASRVTPEVAGDTRYHEVQAGDTLYKISMQYGVDYRDLAAWNGIEAPYTIYPRQRLRVGSDAPAVAAASTEAQQPVPAAPVISAPSAVPANAERVGGAVAASGDSGYDERYGVTVPEGAEPLDGSASTPAPTPPPPTPAEAPIASAPEPVASPATSVATPAAGASAPTASGAVESTAATTTAAGAVASTAAGAATTAAAATPASVSAPTAPSAASARPSAAGWIWPAQGRVVVTYAAGDPTRQGIDIAGDLGSPISAARDGEVVYSGAGLIGYGELIIIKHSPELLSAYGHNRVRLVKEGDKVKAGQKIAEMGKNAANRVLVHFEIRRNGKPVDPQPLLPAR